MLTPIGLLFQDLVLDVTFGHISAETYATNTLSFETNAVYSQYKVAKELNIKSFGKDANKHSNRTLKKFEKNKISDLKLFKSIKRDKNSYETQSGENAHDYYQRKGREMRDNYLKSQNNGNDSGPSSSAENNKGLATPPCDSVTPPWVKPFTESNNFPK